MLSARALASISDDLIELFTQLEFEIKKDIFKRLDKLQKITDLTLMQAAILKETGALKNDVEKLISQYDKTAQKTLKELYYQAMDEAQAADVKKFSLAFKNIRDLSASQAQRVQASINRLYNAETINKTYAAQQKKLEELYNSINRMTLTVAKHTETEFLKQCNRAYMKVTSGAYSWGESYKTAINEQAKEAYKYAAETLARDGVKVIQYDYSGTPRAYSIEAATRMNVLTGINQTASQQTLENAEALGTDLVEVSAHIGARDVDRPGKAWANHAEFQGRVFCLNGERDYIDGDGNTQHAENFAEKCGLGEPDGICGINCRHSFYPYYEGTPLLYSEGELDEMKEDKVTLDGKLITPYEAEQDLRICERNIREYKTQVMALELTGNEDSKQYAFYKNKVSTWQANARHIVSETGIKRKYINEYIGTPDGKQPRGKKTK